MASCEDGFTPECPICDRETEWVCEIDSDGEIESRRPAVCVECRGNIEIEAAMGKRPADGLDHHAPKRGGSQ